MQWSWWGWITVIPAGDNQGAPPCCVLPLPDFFSISSVGFACWAPTAALFTPQVSQAGCRVSPCDSSPFSPLGLPSLWASSPCLTFPPSFHKLGSGSCGGLCGEDKYLLLESQSLTAGQCRGKGLWIKPCCLQIIFWIGCSIYLSWLSCPMASA